MLATYYSIIWCSILECGWRGSEATWSVLWSFFAARVFQVVIFFIDCIRGWYRDQVEAIEVQKMMLEQRRSSQKFESTSYDELRNAHNRWSQSTHGSALTADEERRMLLGIDSQRCRQSRLASQQHASARYDFLCPCFVHVVCASVYSIVWWHGAIMHVHTDA